MIRIAVLVVLLALSACAARPVEEAPVTDPVAAAARTDGKAVTPGPGKADHALFDLFGGLPGITKLIDTMLAEVGNDLRINLLFADTDMAYLRARLIEQICEASGGPCTYTGLSMEEAHSGQNVTPEEFGYFVEDLNISMNKVGMSPEAQRALLSVLGPMQPDVVGK